MSVAAAAMHAAKTTVQLPAAERALRREVDASLLVDAAKGPVDAIVFFNQSQAPAARSAVDALNAAEAMPLGAGRKQAVYDALHTVGNLTLSENLPALQQLQQRKGISGFDTLWSMNAVLVRGASLDTLKSLVGPNVKHIYANEQIKLADVMDAFALDVAARAKLGGV